MNAYQLKTEPLSVRQITEFQIIRKVNDHIYLTLCGTIDGADAEDYLEGKKRVGEIGVTLAENGAEDRILFRGLIKELRLSMDGGIYSVELTAVSHTYMLDQIKRFRTFQNRNQTYKELVKEVLGPYKNAAVICPSGEEIIGEMQIQYQETDWEFLKRMASHLNTMLVAEGRLNKPAFYFGMRKGKRGLEWPVETYVVRDCVINEEKFREYEFLTSEFADIGDQVIFKRMGMQIYSSQIQLLNQEIKCSYQLRAPGKCRTRQYDNTGLAGVSLKGKVVEVLHEKLRISIEEDQGEQTEKQWFDYATVYSSPDGSAWYFMPEKGDEVFLYFPDEKAVHAYVLNAVHMEDSKERQDSDCQFIRNKRNQEIRFTPGQIKITNHRGMSIVLDDEKGIEIRSNKNIILEAGEAIDLNSGGLVAVNGRSAVILKQSNNMIAVRDGIREQGVRIERQ